MSSPVITSILTFSGFSATLACILSAWLIRQHFVNFTQPNIQSKIIGILWMVPIYSLDSFLSLLVPSIALYIDMIRDCYEVFF